MKNLPADKSNKKIRFKSIVSGTLGGIVCGFFGAGGGMLLVPLFARWLKLKDKTALATSVAVIFPLSLLSAVTYALKTDFSVMSAAPYVLGGLVGGIVGGKVFTKVPANFLRKLLALFIIYGGVRSLFF